MENTQNIPDTQVTAQSYAINNLEADVVQQYSYQQNYMFAYNLIVCQDKNSNHVKQALLKRGLAESEANIIIDAVESEIENTGNEKAKKDMLWGAIWCVGGIAITAISYSSASGGGSYVVT